MFRTWKLLTLPLPLNISLKYIYERRWIRVLISIRTFEMGRLLCIGSFDLLWIKKRRVFFFEFRGSLLNTSVVDQSVERQNGEWTKCRTVLNGLSVEWTKNRAAKESNWRLKKYTIENQRLKDILIDTTSVLNKNILKPSLAICNYILLQL